MNISIFRPSRVVVVSQSNRNCDVGLRIESAGRHNGVGTRTDDVRDTSSLQSQTRAHRIVLHQTGVDLCIPAESLSLYLLRSYGVTLLATALIKKPKGPVTLSYLFA